VPQKMSINPDLWKQTRRLAFDMGTTATSIVEEALIAYFAAMEVKQGGRLAKAPQPMSFSAEGTLIPDFSGNHYVRIEDPSQVAAAVKAAGPREFHPVPKPVAVKKARR